MEAAAALGLACNILQLAETSAKLIKIAKQFYDDGVLTDHNEVQSHSSRMQGSFLDLGRDIDTAQSKGLSSPQDLQLIRTANEYTVVARQLDDFIKELDPGTSSTSRNKFRRMGKAIKSSFKVKEIEKLQSSLEKCQRTLDTQILVHLSQKIRSEASRNAQAFSSLNDQQTKVLNCLASGITKSDQIQKSISEGIARIEAQVQDLSMNIENIDRRQEAAKEESDRKALRKSLHFDEMTDRQESVASHHKDTFSWIFKEPMDYKWSSFRDWLQNSEQVYHISGKPGSGKSTLMNYLLENSETKTLLRMNHSDEVKVVSFFFWEPGTQLQRTIVGFLRSILWQLLADKEAFRAARSLREQIAYGDTSWTQKRLMIALCEILDNLDHRFCVFVDGFDECSDQADLSKALRDILQLSSSKVKLCLASRPLLILDIDFNLAKRLRLQDLTHNDIEKATRGQIEESSAVKNHPGWTERDTDWAVQTIVGRAEGVFLWVDLVLKFLLQGIMNRDETEILRKRLEKAPSEIFDLYAHMWDRTKSDHDLYAEETALYLHIVFVREMSLCEFAFATDERLLRKCLKKPRPICDFALLRSLPTRETLSIRLASRCAGLVEVRETSHTEDDDYFDFPEDAQPLATLIKRFFAEDKDQMDIYRNVRKLHLSTRISFIHRTAREYLFKDPRGKKMVDADQFDPFNARLRLIQTSLSMKVLGLVAYSSVHCRRELGQEVFRDSRFPGMPTVHREQFRLLDLYDEVHADILSLICVVPTESWYAHLQRSLMYGPLGYSSDYLGLLLETNMLHFYQYVKNKIENVPSLKSKTYLTYLLSCVCPLASDWGAANLKPLVAYLLDNGADMNRRYLQVKPQNIYERFKTKAQLGMFEEPYLQSAWCRLLMELLAEKTSNTSFLDKSKDDSGPDVNRLEKEEDGQDQESGKHDGFQRTDYDQAEMDLLRICLKYSADSQTSVIGYMTGRSCQAFQGRDANDYGPWPKFVIVAEVHPAVDKPLSTFQCESIRSLAKQVSSNTNRIRLCFMNGRWAKVSEEDSAFLLEVLSIGDPDPVKARLEEAHSSGEYYESQQEAFKAVGWADLPLPNWDDLRKLSMYILTKEDAKDWLHPLHAEYLREQGKTEWMNTLKSLNVWVVPPKKSIEQSQRSPKVAGDEEDDA